jgi:maleylpyruvate isomerase
MKLYTFFRSGSSHRLRIALNLKGVGHDMVPVNLRRGEHRDPAYLKLSPQGFVPVLETDAGQALIQSPAIIEYLDEVYPDYPLLPSALEARTAARGMAAIIGCDIHPLNNLRVLDELRTGFSASSQTIDAWCGKWIDEGFVALEALLPEHVLDGDFIFDSRPGVVECYLVPQVFSARRFRVDLSTYPKIAALDANCSKLDAFDRAAPANQHDFIA